MASKGGRLRVVITGVKEIDARLKTLEPRVQRKVVRQAIRAGLRVVAEAVRGEAPVDTGRMRDAVKVRVMKSKKRGSIALEARIEAKEGLKKTSAKTGKTAFYPAIVEYKHDHFMKRAYDRTKAAARDVALRILMAGVMREAAAGGSGGGTAKTIS